MSLSLTYTQARDEILTLLKAAWDPTTYPMIYDDLKGSVPTTSTPWARATLKHFTGNQSTLANDVGNRRFSRSGNLTVQIFTESGKGLSLSDTLAKIVTDAFEGQTSPSGIWFRNVRYNEAVADGNWYQVNVIVDFEYDELK